MFVLKYVVKTNFLVKILFCLYIGKKAQDHNLILFNPLHNLHIPNLFASCPVFIPLRSSGRLINAKQQTAVAADIQLLVQQGLWKITISNLIKSNLR